MLRRGESPAGGCSEVSNDRERQTGDGFRRFGLCRSAYCVVVGAQGLSRSRGRQETRSCGLSATDGRRRAGPCGAGQPQICRFCRTCRRGRRDRHKRGRDSGADRGAEFRLIHTEGARRVAKAAKEAGAASLVHISTIGADKASPAKYTQTKALGEEATFAEFPAAMILRPSIVFGPEDEFFNRFAALARIRPLSAAHRRRKDQVPAGVSWAMWGMPRLRVRPWRLARNRLRARRAGCLEFPRSSESYARLFGSAAASAACSVLDGEASRRLDVTAAEQPSADDGGSSPTAAIR